MVAYATQQTQGRGPIRAQGWSSQGIEAYAEFTPATMATADFIDMLWVPKGAIITGVALYSDDIDSNGVPTVTLSVGDAASSTRFISASTIGQAGGYANTLAAGTGAMFFKYAADSKIRVTATAGSATFQSGTIKLRVSYLIEPTLN